MRRSRGQFAAAFIAAFLGVVIGAVVVWLLVSRSGSSSSVFAPSPARPSPPVSKASQDAITTAVQKVGETGYTAVHDTLGINRFHSNPQMIDVDLHTLATKLPDFHKIMKAGLTVPAGGYYNWRDADGTIRPKYMYTVPVAGTNLVVAATTYIDEFSRPAKAITTKMNEIQRTYASLYNQRFVLFGIIVLLDLLVLLVVIYFYASSIVRPIRYLSELADRISMGDLRTNVNIKGTGEVVILAQSIERMQTSVRAAIERLQKRRTGGGQK